MAMNTELKIVVKLKPKNEIDIIKWNILHYLKENPIGWSKKIKEVITNHIGSPEQDIFFTCERWEYIDWEVMNGFLYAEGYFKNHDNEIKNFLIYIKDCIDCKDGNMIGFKHYDGVRWFQPIIYPNF